MAQGAAVTERLPNVPAFRAVPRRGIYKNREQVFQIHYHYRGTCLSDCGYTRIHESRFLTSSSRLSAAWSVKV